MANQQARQVGDHHDLPVCGGGSGSGSCARRSRFTAVTHSRWPQVTASLPSVPRLAVNCFPQMTHDRDRGRFPWSSAPFVPPADGLQRLPQILQGLRP